MSEAVSATLVDLDDVDLVETHHRLDKSTDYSSATVMAHHLVTAEMLRRGMTHGHTDDGWSKLVIEVEKTFAVPVAEITSDMPEPVAQEVTAEVGEYADVTTLLSVEGYAMRFDKAQVDDPPVVQEALDEYDQVESETEPPEDLADTLNELLSGVVTLYFQAHGYHWNVTGPNFTQYHILFEEIYTDTYSSIDPLAENIRKLGGFPNWRLRDFFGMSEIEESDVLEGEAEELVPELLASTVVLIEELNEAFDAAIAENQQGIANFIAERIDAHQKWAWQLRASLSDSAWQALDDANGESILATLTDATYKSTERVEKFNPTGINQYTHGGHAIGSMSRGETRRIGGSLGKRSAALHYNEGYDRAKQHMSAGGKPQVREHMGHLARARAGHANAQSHMERQTHAEHAVHSAGYLDAVAGRKRSIRRPLFGTNVMDYATATKASEQEPVVKHPGHPSQKVHGRRAGANGISDQQREGVAAGIEFGRGEEGAPKTLEEFKTRTASIAQPEPGVYSPRPGQPDPRYPDKPETIIIHDGFENVEINNTQSLWHHMEPDGKGGWQVSAERQALHREISEQMIGGPPPAGRGNPPSVEHPTATFLGGGPAAGKTTMEKDPNSGIQPRDERVTIAADHAKFATPEYIQMVHEGRSDVAAGFTHEESSYIAKQAQGLAASRRQSMVIDGLGNSSEEKLTRKVENLRQDGYRVIGRYATVPTNEAVRRAGERGKKTGFNVQERAVREGHVGVSRVAPKLPKIFDDVEVYDTSGGGKPVLIARATRGSAWSVDNSTGWSAFLAKADEPTT